ncbi:hypothetical protein CSE16_11870 [Solibacillus sp. R5-41]|uniref:hypothetical protein n=1 Tax=Solibacillus sp. R5-41 TaxID=2048654 RepID=UPI000C127E0B|nr:hypothetical protein [Solibacillus sp. R5-41]ATP40688.1 hypothetical protein CSE16_11870 [Solibacillus sp. R5-41]
MKSLTVEQKADLVDIAKMSYKLALEARIEKGDLFAIHDSRVHYLNESCYRISSLIYHIVKKEHGISDENNKVHHCLIQFGEGLNTRVYSHFINEVCGEYIDASIEQFNGRRSDLVLSPYENNEQYYKEVEEEKPLVTNAIRDEIEAYEKFSSKQQFNPLQELVIEKYINTKKKAMKKAMKKSSNARLKVIITIGLIPLTVTGLLFVFLPLYLTLHDVKWMIFACLFICVMIFSGYLLYKFRASDL